MQQRDRKWRQRRMRATARQYASTIVADQLTLAVALRNGCELSFFNSVHWHKSEIRLVRRCLFHHNKIRGEAESRQNQWNVSDLAYRSDQILREGQALRAEPTLDLRELPNVAYDTHPLTCAEDVKCSRCLKLARPITDGTTGAVIDPNQIITYHKPGTVDCYTTLPYLQLDTGDMAQDLLYLGHCETGASFSQWGELPAPMGDHLGERIPWHKLPVITRMHIRQRVEEV